MPKVTKKQDNKALVNLAYGLLSFGVCYGFGSWAIDSGSLWHYGLAFASFFFAVHYTKLAIKGWLKTNDKSRTAGKAKG